MLRFQFPADWYFNLIRNYKKKNLNMHYFASSQRLLNLLMMHFKTSVVKGMKQRIEIYKSNNLLH